MVSKSLITIQEINAVDDTLEPPASVSETTGARPATDMPLPQLREQEGNFLVPSHLPNDFSLARSVSGGDAEVSIGYTKTDGKVHIRALQGRHHIQIPVKSGSAKTTAIGETSGHLIRGSWVQHVHRDGREDPITWSADSAITIAFQEGDRWIMIRATPFPTRNGLSESELLRVAGSMDRYDTVVQGAGSYAGF